MAIYARGGDVAAMRAASQRLRAYSTQLGDVERSVGGAVAALDRAWSGADLTRMAHDCHSQALPALRAAATVVGRMGSKLIDNAMAQELASGGFGSSVTGGGGPGPGGPTPGGDWRRPPFPDRRGFDPDGRGGRRVDTDDRTGDRARHDPRSDPRGGFDFSNDWAGRAILARYLSGGDNWTVDNDPQWTAYMQANSVLSDNLRPSVDNQALAAIRAYQETGSTDGHYDLGSRQMEIENGEGIQGYQYLHGTNADVGGFKQSGDTRVEPLENGNYRVVMTNHYQWNDIIDPNGQYVTDRVKSGFAEIITLGQADPYDLHIGWSSQTTIEIDPAGNVVARTGYPR